MNANDNNHNHRSFNSVLIPTEILSSIFSYLQKDYVSLYNCLLVNKFWHLNTLEILYSKPFHLLQSNFNLSQTNNDHVNIQNTLQTLSADPPKDHHPTR